MARPVRSPRWRRAAWRLRRRTCPRHAPSRSRSWHDGRVLVAAPVGSARRDGHGNRGAGDGGAAVGGGHRGGGAGGGGRLGEQGVEVVRRPNWWVVRRNGAGLDAGDSGCIRRVHLPGMLRDAGRAVVLTLLGLALAAVVRRWLPLSLRGAVLVGTVAVGAALAVGATGAPRVGGR